MSSRSIRLNSELIEAAEVQGKPLHRSAPNQIEFWASIGRRLAPVLSHKDLLAIGQGLARIRVETEPSSRIDPDLVFAAVSQQHEGNFVSEADVPSQLQYEISQTPGYIDRVDADGNRITGKMIDGQFVPR